ncbi:heat shock protein 67B3 [Rhagoletis pomonella]|uniref:heat shock protein 67B3 n=1 Tax=Rhagoletis pomonella TaxID=28610 RepID=UPI00177F9E97|nr:heat shock protein 67B3 [Rhagoletis pomonella]
MNIRNIPPFVLSLDSTPYFNHDMYPNHIYRRFHEREHHPLDLATLGLIARLGPHAHHLVANKHNQELNVASRFGKKGFEVHLDVGLFEPEDLNVKIVDDSLVIEGKHEEREDDHGHISRHFVRRYVLPKGFDPDTIVSTLSSDGALTVRVPSPPPPPEEQKKERIIAIQQVGPSEIFSKTKSQEEADASAAKLSSK